MKVLHIVSGNLTGGAARGAYWLHNGLIAEGINSTLMISGRSKVVDDSIISLSDNYFNRVVFFLRRKIDSLLLRLYKNRKGFIFSTGFFGYNFIKTEAYKQADIINLHWVNAGLIDMKVLSKIDKPIVWTLRDMWPITGGCHYSLDCEKYITGCGGCPQLNSRKLKDLSYFIFQRKIKFIKKNLIVVGISNWLTNEAKRSLLFKDHKCISISNNIDTNSFQNIDKLVARNILGINTNKKIVLCGSTNIKDFYKGFQKYLDSLKYLDPEKVILCFFGRFDKALIENHNFEYKSFDYLYDNRSLNLVYSAADVFVAPSIQEAFGKTLAEAQCSGTPVVCFDATGTKDLVDHMKTGYKATPFSSKDLANGINWVLNHDNPLELSFASREKVLEEFDSSVIAKKYVTLYKSLI